MTRNDWIHEKLPYFCIWQNVDHGRKISSTNFVDNVVVTGNECRISEELIKK
jgi:hypothetical protein